MKTDHKRYDHIPVPIIWARGRKEYQHHSSPDNSHLWIEVPDEVCLRIQGIYAGTVMLRWFGLNSAKLPKTFHRPGYIPPMQIDLRQRYGYTESISQYVLDNEMLLQALEATVSDTPKQGNFDMIRLFEYSQKPVTVELVGDYLEINIQNALPEIEQDWIDTFKTQALREV
jgi:hypothetical protein